MWRPGSSITIDIAAQGVVPHDTNGTPADPSDDRGGILGYQFNLTYDHTVMTVTAVTLDSNSVNLIVANPGSALFVGGGVLPDGDGSYDSTVLDTGPGTPESGSGVLERITLTIREAAAAGQYNLLIDPSNIVQLDATGAAYLTRRNPRRRRRRRTAVRAYLHTRSNALAIPHTRSNARRSRP